MVPWVGAIVGAIAGVHRYLIDIDGVTAVPRFYHQHCRRPVGAINRKVAREQRWKIGILAGMMCETLTMILVGLGASESRRRYCFENWYPDDPAASASALSCRWCRALKGKKEPARRGRRNWRSISPTKPLPLFRHVNSDSLRQVCEIIRRDITADAVAITNTEHVLASRGRR
ncbi:hypothetical protein MJ561_21100 [Klebsiella pneumoniae]|nr:hypothetical protein MJ561_21100 [Klebsiella pneumoniae]